MEKFLQCQSCGMTFDERHKQYIAKDKDGNDSIYCTYCYRDGEFIDPRATMEDMIELAVPHFTHKTGDEEAARKYMTEVVSSLSRWKTNEKIVKIALIHGQNHKGSTYHIARMTAEKIGGSTEEFYPEEFSEGCLGCYACINKGMTFCPHYDRIGPVLASMLSSDVIVIGSPTYVLEMTGQLKCFFDHLFSAWLSHRPEKSMFSKIAVVVSTAAGIGMNGVTKSIARQLFYLGVPKIYRMPVRVASMSWDMVQRKEQISAKAHKIARKVADQNGKAKPGLRLRFMFSMMRLMHKKNDWAPLDKRYWKDMGWLEKGRPWKSHE